MPDMIYVRSAEPRLALHVAVAHHHVATVESLLHRRYPSSNMLTFVDPDSTLTYEAGLEVNAQDSNGETALHIACRSGYADIARLLLEFSVRVEVDKTSVQRARSVRSKNFELEEGIVEEGEEGEGTEGNSEYASDSDDGTTDSSQSSPRKGHSRKFYRIVYPVSVSAVTSRGFTPLHLAIRNKHVAVVKEILDLRGPPSNIMKVNDRDYSVVLYAFEEGNTEILRLLLSHGMLDIDNKALSAAFFAHNAEAKWLLLTHKSSRDLNHSINKTEMRRLAYRLSHAVSDTLDRCSSLDPELRSKFPTTPVSIGWEGLGVLSAMDARCVSQACVLHNPALTAGVLPAISLCAVTKVDISRNSFEVFPAVLLELPSLVLLRASRNQIGEIPSEVNVLCVSLEEVHLNENKIRTLPRFLFQLPQLKFLDVSVNRVSEVPPEVWSAPSLVTLHLSGNSLSWLPTTSRDQLSWPPPQGSGGGAARPRRVSMGSLQRDHSGSVGSYDLDPLDVSVDGVEFTILSHQDVSSNSIVRVNKWGAGVTVEDRDPWKRSGQGCGLKQLWLNRNRFTQVPPCLACCAPTLEVLVLSDNPLTSACAVSDYPPSLVELDLSRTGLTSLDVWRSPGDAPHDMACFGPLSFSQTSRYSCVPLSTNNSPGNNYPRSNSTSNNLHHHHRSNS
ncbi:leucine-rich repeat serine/threonine-protein kinase 1, partial [Aplysia californica]|uniref:Leucine-rich repeat serine/threonine-protein kinase 1 n=1 Tax=Aplysia californica TaxID=6500 RepID=A0ABM1AFM5_APLCA